MKQFFLTMAGVFAGLALFFIGIPFLLLSVVAAVAHPATTPASAVLALDLRKTLTDQEPQNPFASFSGRSLAVTSVIDALHRAETDAKVKALFIRLPEAGVSPGEADELRLAIRRFKASGKPVIAHSQGLYPAGAVASTYMIGAASGELWMQPGAPFQATGMANEDPSSNACSTNTTSNPISSSAMSTRTPSTACSTTTTRRPTARANCRGWVQSTTPRSARPPPIATSPWPS
jgi:protease-4